jgi:hypothetical protein
MVAIYGLAIHGLWKAEGCNAFGGELEPLVCAHTKLVDIL